MAEAGIRSTNIDTAEIIDELLANRTQFGVEGTVRITVDSLGRQLASEGALKDIIVGSAIGLRQAATWAALNALVGEAAGQPGRVTGGAETTHVDPVVGGSVKDQGEYAWSTAPAGWRRVGDSPLFGKATEDVALAGEDDGVGMTPATTALVVGAAKLESYRTALWVLMGDGDPVEVPVEVSEAGKVLRSRYASNGLPVDAAALGGYRAALWTFIGDGDPAAVPVDVSETGKVILARSAADGQLILVNSAIGAPDAMAYVEDGELWIVGGAGGDRTLNDDADKTWISAVPFVGSTLAVYQAGGTKHLARVSYLDGTIYPDGEVTLWTNDGQSNGEGQAGSAVAVIHPYYPWASRLRMTNLGVRLGMTTAGGASLELDPDTITSFVPLADALEGTGSHGSTSVASAAYFRMKDAAARCAGWVPNMLVWGNAEGGQSIANLSAGAPAGKFAYANTVSALTVATALLAATGQRLVYRWQVMAQGESDGGDALLGSKHDLYRSQLSAAAAGITGQTEPVRMMDAQMSNFFANSAHVRSILAYAVANEAAGANFWCLGPTYCYPLGSDFLHHTSLGHVQMGELAAVAARVVENGGIWRPLMMTEAHITNTNEITVTLSEAAINDEAAGVAAIANKGIAVPGKTVASVVVAGTSIVITLTGPAAGATTVQSALVGHVSPTRTEATIPRSTIRSTASYGAYENGSAMRKWLTHWEVSIT